MMVNGLFNYLFYLFYFIYLFILLLILLFYFLFLLLFFYLFIFFLTEVQVELASVSHLVLPRNSRCPGGTPEVLSLWQDKTDWFGAPFVH